MKLLALRVAQFGRFGEPVAVEDIGDGVNVLAGPNEMGKSTLFGALEAAFLTRHRVTGAGLERMRPRTGGEPMVEVDFAAHGRTWRLRKQFGKGAAAVLTDLSFGEVVARAADAEDRVTQLTGRSDDLPGRLGLVWVRQQHTLSAAEPDIDPATGKAKPRGERQALIDVVGNEVENAAGGEAFNAVQRLVETARENYVTSARAVVKKNGPYDIALKAREALRTELTEAQRAADAAAVRLASIIRLSAELAEKSATMPATASDVKIIELEARIARAVDLRGKRDVARQALRTAQSEALAARQALQAHADAAQRRQQVIAAHAAAQALETEIRTLVADINADAATPARIGELIKLDHDIALARAQIEADAAVVDISLEPGHANRVRAGGSAVTHDQTLQVAGELAIGIEGIATISIASGGPRARAADARRAKAEAEMQSLLSAMGAAATEDAKARGEARSLKVDALDRARAKLSGFAPKGSAALAAELQDRAETPAQSADERLEAKLHSAEAALSEARSALEQLEADAPSDEAFRDLSAGLQRLKEETARHLAHVNRLTLMLEKLKSEQSGADEDGRAGRVAGLRGELERAQADVKRIEDEVAALGLLSSTLMRIEAHARNRYFLPVSQKLAPHLTTLFGTAEASFKDHFSPQMLTRNGAAESVASLSDGTREQLSVLVRLSFAELLADGGEGPPLILDDPLVYSDDDRLEAMCRILSESARRLQVLVLTCRAHAFKDLPGRRLSVTPWRPGL